MPDPILALSRVSAFYDKLCAVRDVDLSIRPGECLCIIGPNGAGKSTLLKAISRVIRKVSGEIRFLGRPTAEMTPQELVGAGLIHVPEGRLVFSSLSVADNLRIGGFQHRREPQSHLVDQVFDLFPRLRERRNQPAGSLSGGEQQMLAIGRALMGRPKLLMLDEPSMGLAPIVVAEIYREIRQLRERGVTVLLVEQNAKLALELADHALVLSAGAIRFAGPASDLARDEGARRFIFGH